MFIVRATDHVVCSCSCLHLQLSSYFVPVVVTLSLITFLVWFIAAKANALPNWEGRMDQGDFLFSFLFALSVIVIACPCALGLATPTAVMVGTGLGASMGVLIKGGAPLEAAHHVNCIVFDKTGTLTQGKPVVTHVDSVQGALATDGELLQLLGSAEKNSEHVLGKAVVKHVIETLGSVDVLAEPQDFKAVTGRGLSCKVKCLPSLAMMCGCFIATVLF